MQGEPWIKGQWMVLQVLGQYERDLETRILFLLQHRSGHGNCLIGLIAPADVAGKIPKSSHTRSPQITRGCDTNNSMGRVTTKLESLVGLEYFVGLNLGQELGDRLFFAGVSHEVECTVDVINQDVLTGADGAGENAL